MKKKISGIYRIVNTVNNKCYVGRSVGILGRFKQHKYGLRHGDHHSIYLQRAWDKYGEEAFKFEILEEIQVDNSELLIEHEQRYMDMYDSVYSIGVATSGGDNISNHPEYDTIRKNIGNATRKRISELSDGERHEKFAKYGTDNPNYGNKWTPEQRQSCSATWSSKYENGFISPLRGVPKSEVHRKKISEFAKTRTGNRNPFYGKVHSDNTISNLRSKALERGNSRNTQKHRISVDDVIYESYGDAHKKLSIPLGTIRWRVLSKNPKFDNYKLA